MGTCRVHSTIASQSQSQLAAAAAAACHLPLATCHQHTERLSSDPREPREQRAGCTLRYLISSFTDLIFFQIYRSQPRAALYPFLYSSPAPGAGARAGAGSSGWSSRVASSSLSLSLCVYLVLDVLSLDWFGLLLLWFAAWLLRRLPLSTSISESESQLAVLTQGALPSRELSCASGALS